MAGKQTPESSIWGKNVLGRGKNKGSRETEWVHLRRSKTMKGPGDFLLFK